MPPLVSRVLQLAPMLKEQGFDLDLVQEAQPPPSGIAIDSVPSIASSWTTSGGRRNFCAAVVALTPDVSLIPLPLKPLYEAGDGDIPVAADAARLPQLRSGLPTSSPSSSPASTVSGRVAWAATRSGRTPLCIG